jgi:peptidoglycan/LPS O-acetylase OafA/YrhL
MRQLTEVLDELPIAAAHDGRRFYRPELDGLRFYAFLGVFVLHTLPSEEKFYRGMHLPLPRFWAAIVRSGGAGVDLFFVLSAFLITCLLLRERRETGTIALRKFYFRRILRIWPLYFLMIAVGVVLSYTIVGQILQWYYVAGYLLFVGNCVHAIFGAPRSICSPLWTISIEEQFYLIWPLLMMKLKHRGIIVAAGVTFLLATVSQVSTVLGGGSWNSIYYGSLSRCNSFAVGILLAIFTNSLPRLTSAVRLVLICGGLMGWVASSLWLIDRPGPIDIRLVLGRVVISLASGAILLGALYSESALLRSNLVVSLGKISYGLYMLHFAGILFAETLLHPVSAQGLLETKGLGLLVTVFLASASYRWFESPFLRLKDSFATVLSRPV